MATHLEVGDPAPDFTLGDATGAPRSLSELRGRPVVLAFYPFDFSGTCTEEHACFADALPALAAAKAQVIGVSVDHRHAHKAYAEARGIEYPLLTDFHPKGEVGRAYGVYYEDKGFHARTIFVIDGEGVIRFVQENEISTVPDVDEIVAAVDRLT